MRRCVFGLAALLTAAPALADEPAPRRRSLTRTPKALASFGAAVIGDELYLIGGHVGRPHHHSRDNLSTGFYRLNLLDGQSWEALPGGVALQSVALVAHHTELIRVGGLSARNAEDEKEDLHSTDEVQRYDPLTRRWTPMKPLPEKRSSHDAYVAEDTLFVLGGWNLAGDEQSWFKHGWSLDLSDPKADWVKVAQPFIRRALAVTAFDGKVYAIGGITRKGSISSRVDVYDTEKKSWTRAQDLPGPGFGTAAVGLRYSGSIYATDWKGKVHALGPDGRWTTVAHMEFPRFFHRLVATGEKELAAIAGASFGGKIRHIERIDIEADRRPTITTGVVPVPVGPHRRGGMLLKGADITYFGGASPYIWGQETPSKSSLNFNINRLRLQSAGAFPEDQRPVKEVQGRLIASYVGEKAAVAYAFRDTATAVYRFDPKDRSWTALEARLPKPMPGAGAVDYKEALWIFSGRALLRIDPESEVVEEVLQDIGLDVSHCASALIGDKVYFLNDAKGLNSYDLEARRWTKRARPEGSLKGAELTALDGILFLGGGKHRGIQAYDPEADRWTAILSDHGAAIEGARLFTLNKRLLLIGRMPGKSALRFALIDPRFQPTPAPKPAPAEEKKAEEKKKDEPRRFR